MGFLLGDELINDCIDLMKAKFVVATLENKELSPQTEAFLKNVCEKVDIETDKELSTVIFKMALKARERSHGAALLDTTFVSEEDYLDLIKKAGLEPNVRIRINNININRSKNLVQEKEVIGICRPKFKNVPLEQLIIKGKIDESLSYTN
jgi:hypothetical protein